MATTTLACYARTAAAAVFALLIVSGSAQADDKWAYALPASGHIADYLSSVKFSAQPGTSCIESNQLARHADGSFDARKGAAWTAAVIGSEWLVLKLTRKSKNEQIRLLGKVVAISGGSIGWSMATHNLAFANCGRR